MLNREEVRLLTVDRARRISTRALTSDDGVELQLSLPINGLTTVLYAVVGLLLVLSLFFTLFDQRLPDFAGGGWLHRVTNLDGEANLPTFVSAGLLLLCSGLSLLIARTERRLGARLSGPAYWRLLSLLLFLMAADELLMLHETLGGLLDRLFQLAGVYTWVLPGTLLVLWFVRFFLPFFRSLPGVMRRLLVLALGLFVGGAGGVEVLEALNRSVTGEFGLRGLLLTNLQETLELLGEVVLLKALLVYIRDFMAYPRTRLAVSFGD